MKVSLIVFQLSILYIFSNIPKFLSGYGSIPYHYWSQPLSYPKCTKKLRSNFYKYVLWSCIGNITLSIPPNLILKSIRVFMDTMDTIPLETRCAIASCRIHPSIQKNFWDTVDTREILHFKKSGYLDTQ